MRKKFWYLLLVLACFSTNIGLSQIDQQGPFNSSFWNGYADKLQLGAAERLEFITAHKREHDNVSLIGPKPQQIQSSSAGRGIGGNNTTFAGPCVNADFELGSISGWSATCGFHPGFNPIGCCPNPGGKQAIVSGTALDAYGGFPVVYPGGGSYSLKLGDSLTGGQADRIEQTFVVSATNANFSYRYAVVFQDPNHPVNQQPFFEVNLVDVNNNDVPCTHYYVASGAGIPGFFNSSYSGIIYKPWTTVLVDLTPYIGQTITIKFSTYDCSLGGHFGYAYIDGVCQSFSGGGSTVFCAGTSTTFCAPTGAASYTWSGPGSYNSNAQCAVVSTAGVYTVNSTLFTGCPGPAFTYTLIDQQPVTTAGLGGATCLSNPVVLNGSVSVGATTGTWSTVGDGSFSPDPYTFNASYTPGPNDIAAGSVKLSLSSANNGICPVATDTALVLIKKPAIADAGANQILCSSNSTIALAGIVSAGSTTTGVWTSPTTGPAAFTPTSTNLNAIYHMSAADISAQAVTLTLTSTNNGPCPAASDTVMMVLIKPSVVSAGPNQFLCSSSGSIDLSGSVTGFSNTGVWTGSGVGAFNPGITSLNTSYMLTANDISTGSVIFTLTSTNNGPCAAVQDTVKMKIRIPATANAGANQILCSNTSSIALSGSIGGGSSAGIWTATGPGAFTSANTALTATYGITAADIAAGSVIFTLTSTGNGPCAAVQDTAMIPIVNIATISAGPSQNICSNAGLISLSGSINSPSNTVVWNSSGSGVFPLTNGVISPTYSMTTTDINNGSVSFTVSSTNNGPCPVIKSNVTVTIKKLAIINAGLNQNLCSNTPSINLSGSMGGGATTVTWTSSGLGGFVPVSNSLITSYGINAADIVVGHVIFTLTSTNNGPCPAVSDTVLMAITNLATVSAGPNLFVCSSDGTLNLAGSVVSPSNTGLWSGNGTGLFLPNNTAVANTYSFSAADVAAGTVIFTLTSTNNGVCPAVPDTVKMRIMKLATVNVSTIQPLCSNISTVTLNGALSGASGTGVWSTSGTGTYVPGSTSFITTYSITPADVTTGLVTFTLASTNNGPCPVVSSTAALAISKIATVSAGPNQYVCSSQNSIALTGNINGVTSSGQWVSSGAGIFQPGNLAMTTNYSITANDVANGTVTFTLTSTNNSVCPAVSDTVMMRIMKLATVSAGTTQALCSTISTLALNGSVLGSNGSGIWSSNGAGTFIPGNATLNTTYSIMPADVAAGLVIFTLSSTNNGPCAVVSNTSALAISKIATVNAGPNQYLCSSQGSIGLSGQVSGVTSTGQWASSGAGVYIPGNAALSTNYSLTASDIALGTVIFTLTSTSNSVCPAVSDTVKMRIMKQATVSAGANQALCSSAGVVSLHGTVAGSSGAGIWTSDGAGPFNPSSSALITSYSMTPADISNGAVIFTLTSTGNGPCQAMNDSVKVTIRTIASVNAGANQFVCSAQNSITLSGIIGGGGSTGLWSSSGSGTFVPGNTSLSNAYVFSASDIQNGIVTLTLVSTGNGVCPFVNDTVKMRIRKMPVINAGPNQALCSSWSSIALTGSLTGGGGAAMWTSNGSGAYNPGPGALNSLYAFSQQDINAGMVNFTLSSQGSAPCPEVSDTVAMVIRALAQVAAGPSQTICSNTGSVSLSGSVTGGTGTGTWTASGSGAFSPNNSTLSTIYNLTPTDISNGSVSFRLGSTNNGPCPQVAASNTVFIKQLAIVNAGPDKAICANQLQISIHGTVSGVTSSGTWNTNGSGTISPNAPNSGYSVSPIDVSQGTVTMVLTSTGNDVCPAVSDTMILTIESRPLINVGADTSVCQISGLISLSHTVSGGSAFQWASSGSGAFLPHNTIAATHYSLSPADRAASTISLALGAPSNGPCGYTGATMQVHIFPQAHAAFSASEYTVQLPGPPIQFANVSASANTYSWSFGDGQSSSQSDPSHAFPAVGYYNVTLIANNTNNCPDTTQVTITVLAGVQFPTAFTPNTHNGSGGYYNPNDYSNDVFFPFTEGVVSYDLMIFNRWGELIFRSNDVKIGWDGYFNGKLCQQDAYVYKVNMEFFDGRKYNKTGSVTLLR